MPWGLMDDKFHRNRKVRALRREGARGREALGVWVYWWSWCLDDPDQTGIVPREEMSAGDLKVAALLEEKELWKPVADGWRIHDFHDYLNGNRHLRDEKRDAKREADRVRVANSRAASRADVAEVARDIGDILATVATEARDMSPGVAELVAPLSQPRARALPVPSLPLPSPTQPNPQGGVRAWGFKALEQVISARRQACGGGPYKHTTGDYSKIEEAVELFREVDAENPADAAAYAFDAWARTKWATEATWPVSAWLKDPAKHFTRAKEPS